MNGERSTSNLKRDSCLKHFLKRAPSGVFVTFAIFASFGTYFCMYAFRKPFAAATFQGEWFLSSNIELKTAIVISQILGYTLSKYVGIKFCSEVSEKHRAAMLIGLITFAEVSLLVYGLVPNNWKVLAIFFNGLPLGMVWGLVVWYLEGRRTSELLLAGLSCSFIISSGIVKDFGRALMSGEIAMWWKVIPVFGKLISPYLEKVNEGWMPAVVGLHFLPLFMISVWLLNQLPSQTPADQADRHRRIMMNSKSRSNFVREFLWALVLLCLAYFFLTAYRDFRDNYQVELFEELGYPYLENKTIITKAETLVAFGVMGGMALLNLIRDNRLGLIGAYGVILFGLLLLAVATLFLEWGLLSGFWWMTFTGLGSYLAYVPYCSVLFDRLMAATRVSGTAVFAIYLADAIGYTGSVGVQLYKDLAHSEMSRLAFFKGFNWFITIFGSVCMIASCLLVLKNLQSKKFAKKP